MRVSSINSYNNPSFDGYKFKANRSSIYLNPIKYQVDKVFERSLKMARNRICNVTPELNKVLKEVAIKSKEVDTYAYDIQNPKNSNKYVLFLHGLGQNISANQPLYKEILNDTDYSILAPEYRGFGKNKPATMSNETFLKDSQAALDYLVNDKGVDPKKICVVGHSFGGYIASALAKENNNLGKLILVSPIDNLGNEVERSSAVKHIKPIYLTILKHIKLFRLYLKNLFNTKSELEKTTVPTEIIHCKNDKVVNIKSAQFLAMNTTNLCGIHILDKGGHAMENNKITAILNLLKIN